MVWSTFICTDVQLFCLLPLLYVLYKRAPPLLFYFVLCVLAALSCMFLFLNSRERSIQVQTIAFENFYQFNDTVRKPYLHFCSLTGGVLTAVFYINVLKFRQAPSQHPIIASLSDSVYFFPMGSAGIAFVCILVPGILPTWANLHAYSWTDEQNILYYTFSRPVFLIG